MSELDRRNFLLASSAGLVMAGLGNESRAADAATPPAPAAVTPMFPTTGAPKPLGFDPAKLAGLSDKLIRSHWENNYSGSVKTLNTVNQRLAAALADKDTPPFLYGDLKREQLIRTGSVVLHELYFDNLGGDGKPDAVLRTTLGKSFGSFDAWETEFRKIGASLGGGSGWVVLGYNQHLDRPENYWLADHAHSPAATLPLLVMDMYEHSYQMDYGAASAKYIDAFFQNIRWEEVGKRLAKVRPI